MRPLDGARKAALADKIAKLKKMVAFARTVPNDWNAHGRLAGTPKGIGAHALQSRHRRRSAAADAQADDVGRSSPGARATTAPLTAAELEMMNLTGDGNGYDMLTMPAALRAEGADVELLPARRL